MTDVVRPNPVRQRLMSGGAAFGTMAFECFSPGLPYILAQGGAEFCIFDMEHSGVSIDTIKQMIAASHGAGLVPMVRVPGCAYHLIAPVLDAGAMGIMVPMTETVAQAEQIAQWCRYRPQGVRGLAFGLAHDGYGPGDIVAKMAAENERTLVIALIETATGIANIEQIMAVPGIDVGWLGHYDLTDSMGIPGQFDDPGLLAGIARLTAACAANGKAAGFLPGSPAQAREYAAKGFRCLAYGTDVALLREALRHGIAECRMAVQEARGG